MGGLAIGATNIFLSLFLLSVISTFSCLIIFFTLVQIKVSICERKKAEHLIA